MLKTIVDLFHSWLRGICLGLILFGIAWFNSPGLLLAQPEIATPEVQLQQLEEIGQAAMQAMQNGDFEQAEKAWTQMLELFPDNPAAWSNRGNVKAGQYKLQEAMADYNRAIELAPNFPDSYLNRGVTLEALGQWQAAIADYDKVLQLDPVDPSALNNRGNAKAGLGDWSGAIADYRQAAELDPSYLLAAINYDLALYQIGETELATRKLKSLVRKYPNFADARAALTAALWSNGKQGEAESQWVAVIGLDRRYKDLNWVAKMRRWPPSLVSALDNFLRLQ